MGYDFFSGLTTKSTKERKTGKIIDSKIIETTEDMEVAAGLRLAGQAGAEFSNPFTSELARASENTSPTRSSRVPALAYRAGELGSNGGNQPGDSEGFLDGQSQAGLQMDNQKDPTIRTANDPSASWEYSSSVLIREIRGQNASSPATTHSPLITTPQALARDCEIASLTRYANSPAWQRNCRGQSAGAG